VVAGAANEIVKAGALAAKDNDEIAGEIELVVCGRAAFVETDDPEVAALEVFEGADEIHDTSDAEVLGGASAGFDGDGAEGSGAALGEENAVDTGAVGDAEKRAEVLRVFHSIEGEDEARGRGAGGIGSEEIFEGKELLRADERDNTLVGGSFCGEGKLIARFEADADACVAALGDEAANARIAAVARALAGDEDVIETAAASLESFRDRMQTVEDFHGIQFTARDAKGAG
jgi:hypothetical protein